MSVLFMMPSWSAPSELWMQRMIEALEPHIAVIAAWEPEQSHWRDRIPSLRLKDDSDGAGKARFARAVRSPDISCVLAHYIPFALRFTNVWDSTRTPLFVHCHGYDITWDLRRHDDPDQRFHPADYVDQVRRLARRATFIANSAWSRTRLRQIGVPARGIAVKPFGVPVPEHAPARQANSKRLTALYLGRLVDFKGPDLVIRAFELARDRGLEAKLVLAGDGPMRSRCAALREASAYVRDITLLGAVDPETGTRLRARADIFTAHNLRGPFTRQEEAFGVSVIEAMACGLPVVTGRSGALTETIRHGETGLLVEPGDVEAHAEALLRLARDPAVRQRMGEAGRRVVGERFSPGAERARLLSILGLDRASPAPRAVTPTEGLR